MKALGLLLPLLAVSATAGELVVAVPAGETVELASRWTAETSIGVTNIRKTGAGDLIATPLPDYAGDFTIDEGRFILNQHGDLGKDNVGTCYVNDGATLCYCKNDKIARGETIVFAGAPAAGRLGKLERLTVPTGYTETWEYFSDAATSYRATDAAVTFAHEKGRFQLLGTFDANGQDLILDQRYGGKWATMQFNLGLKIENGKDVIVGYAKDTGGVEDSYVAAQLLFEKGLTLSSKNGNSRLVIQGNQRVTRSNINFSSGLITTDGHWTLQLSTANVQTSATPTVVPGWRGPVVCEGLVEMKCSFTIDGTLSLPRDWVVRGRKLPVSGTLQFAPGSVVEVVGEEALPEAEGYELVTAEHVEGKPILALNACTKGWRVKTTETSVGLGHPSRGFIVSIMGGRELPPTPVTYRKVTFRRLNGTILDQIAVADGSALALPDGPEEAEMRFVGWDRAEKLASVTADLDVWALYEATTAKSPSTSIASKSIAVRNLPYSLEEYFQLYDHLAWSDEFSGTALDVGRKIYGSYYYGGTWNYDMEQRNGELHKHVESCASVSDGALRITTRRKTNGNYSFEGGGVTTKGKVAFTFGRCEIRAKLCRGLGVWPAFWFMGSKGNWPSCGEIDALEQMNGGAWIASTLHIPNSDGSSSTIQTQATCGPTDGVHWADDFHRFGVIVNEREIVFYTDDLIHERIDISDPRYNLLRDRAQYILLGSGMGGAWSGVTSVEQVPAGFESEDYVIDSCRIFTNETEGRTLERAHASAQLSGPLSATVWKGWSMSWGKSGAGAYQNDISTNGFTEAFYVDCALNGHVNRDRPDVVLFLTEPACMTGADSGAKNFWTNLQLKAEGMLVAHPRRLADTQHEALCAAILYDGRRFSATDSICASVPFADTSYTGAAVFRAELKERATGAVVTVYGVNSESATATELKSVIEALNVAAGARTLVFFQGLNSSAYQNLSTASAELDEGYRLLGEDRQGYRRVYATGQGQAEKPNPLTIVNSARPTRASLHTMQALQAIVTFD